MATTLTELRRLQREVETLKKKVARLERLGNNKRKTSIRKRTTRSQRYKTMRQAAQRNAMDEEEAMALALQAQHT
jgi:hypothetical protein